MQNHHRIIIFFLFLFPVHLFAQDITGLWKGYMYNDTTEKNYKYEIAISENKGKLLGYSHTYFIIDDKEYHGVKRVKIKRVDDKIIVEDVELIANNYPIVPPKGVHQISALVFEQRDTVMILAGQFTTTRTREYHSVTGYIHLERKRNYHQSALIPHLEELGLAQNLSFVKQEEQQPEEETKTIAKIDQGKVTKETVAKKGNQSGISPNTKPAVKPGDIKAPDPEIKTPPAIVVSAPAADAGKRKVETIESVYYKSDSLVLTLYDNGEVDGDTVSVLMNGKVIMPKVGLTTTAVKHTIDTKNSGDSIQIVMYAETLGSLPPNTGLLIVYDGQERYEIRFSGDMKKSPAIVFRRRN